MALFEAGDFKGAKLKFNRVSMTAANYLQATEYLQKINSVRKASQEGLTSFFEGNKIQSIQLLSEALIVYQTNPNVRPFWALPMPQNIFYLVKMIRVAAKNID